MQSLESWLLSLPEIQRSFLAARMHRFVEAQRDAGVTSTLQSATQLLAAKVFLASNFAFDVAELRAAEFTEILRDPEGHMPGFEIEAESSEDFTVQLRRFRYLQSAALIVRDVAGIDSIQATLHGANALALTCIEAALQHLEQQFLERYGVARSSSGEPQRLAVIGMGKLGGGELNFSSDVDLILAFAEAGQTDGAKSLDNEEYFIRLGQKLAQLLGDMTSEGFVLRVDYRLRPYGSAGRLALSFNAMEQYYQREGRDWERYAWIKAQPVAGDKEAGARLVAALRPFIYRRYLDFTAIEGLRELKARIDGEVERKDLANNLKSGPGGIRELEFAVQLAQLIRGGRESSLRVNGFLPALEALHQSGQFDRSTTESIRAHYLFLRRIENRLQMLADKQTHSLPESAFERTRIALALNYADEHSMLTAIQAVRWEVQELFARILDTPLRGKQFSLPRAPETSVNLAVQEFAESVRESIAALLNSLPVRRMDTRARERFERALPMLMLSAQNTSEPENSALRLLRLLHAIAGRPSYLALLAERRAARERLVEIFAQSTFLAERVIFHPLLLDDLLDHRMSAEPMNYAAAQQLLAHNMSRVAEGDVEAELAALHETQQSAVFRIALAWLNRSESSISTAQSLATIAELFVREVLHLARRDLLAQHGEFPEGLLLLAYGSFAGQELGFESDLDLVFLFDSGLVERSSNGLRPLECRRYMARLSQRILHWLSTPTSTGVLYEVDTRLRPDGEKGLLVSTLDAFRDYQLNRAWVWEHQALVRARVIAGPETLRTRFMEIRREVLCRLRNSDEVRTQVGQMRERWRRELDRSDAREFDLKQGMGGLVDIEFLLQGLVLIHASHHPELIETTATADLIACMFRLKLLNATDTNCLLSAHSQWLEKLLDCAVNGRQRLVACTSEVQSTASAVTEIIGRHGFF